MKIEDFIARQGQFEAHFTGASAAVPRSGIAGLQASVTSARANHKSDNSEINRAIANVAFAALRDARVRRGRFGAKFVALRNAVTSNFETGGVLA